MKTLLIRIDEPDDGCSYPVALFVDDGGEDWFERPQAQATIPCPLPASIVPQLDQFDLADGTAKAIRKLLLAENPRSEAFEKVGVFLHDLLACADVGRRWQEVRDADGREGVRLLLDVRARELRELPWELMRRSDSPLPLFLDERNPCARVRWPGTDDAGPEHCPFLRVLVVVGAKPEDAEVEAALELEGLRDGLRRLWGLVDIEVLYQPLQADLERCYEEFEPHVLHFIGHGRAPATGGVLDIDGRDGGDGWSWTTTDIAATLTTWRPRLVFVNACRSAARRSAEGAWQVADALLDAGVPAVLGMQGDIHGHTAAAFTGALYAALAAGRSLDVAVVAARRAIQRDVDPHHRDPWLPCLWLSMLSEPVLGPRYDVTPRERALIERKASFAAMKRFVNRKDERRFLWRLLWRNPDDGGTAGELGRAISVVGQANIGKSELVKWALGLSALHGANVAYVDLRRHGKLDFVGVLTAIKAEFGSSPVHRGANRMAFSGFDATMPGPNAAEGEVDTIFGDFAEAVVRAAAGKGTLLLGLDHVEGVELASWRLVLEKFVVPVAENALPVRLIIVGDENRELRDLGTVVEQVSLGRLPRADYSELVYRYLRAQGFDAATFCPVVEAFEKSQNDSWDGSIFQLLDITASYLKWQREAA